MTFGSLFAGIGGMDLGLERAGFECRWQVEIDPFCRRVLARHWPDVPRHDDVRSFLDGDDIERYRVDLIAGGFPCQDVSDAGKRIGIDGSRSGLWTEFARVVREIRPRFVLVENTTGLLVRGIDAVLGTLAAMGFDAEWACVPASWFGASHIRERVFILAHDRGVGLIPDEVVRPVTRQDLPREAGGPREGEVRGSCFDGRTGRSGRSMPDPGVWGMADGIPTELDRMRVHAIGNAVCPIVAQWLGRLIIEAASLEDAS